MSGKLWTDERAARAKELWIAGQSASQIARELGITRNAVIGKVHRLGLKRDIPQRSYPRVPSSYRKGAAALAAAKAKTFVEKERRVIREKTIVNPLRLTPQPPAPPSPVIDVTQARDWRTRRFGECAFPVGGEGADTLSCCLPTKDGATYCKGHRAIMYAPSKANERLKRGADRFAAFIMRSAA